jgi:hypothetical protein
LGGRIASGLPYSSDISYENKAASAARVQWVAPNATPPETSAGRASQTGETMLRKLAVFLMTAAFAATTFASSHREAPLITEDQTMDNTDVYAFISPDAPNTVTIIANYIPLE